MLGIAKKTIVAYENDKTVPNDSYYTLIKSLIKDRSKLMEYANINRNSLSKYETKKIFEGNKSLINLACDPFQFILEETPTPYNGYQTSDKGKIINIILYITSKVKGKTKLAKTLFFSDAIAYSETASSLTGIKYAAINNGPIPDQFDSILDFMIQTKKLELEIKEFHNFTQYNYNPILVSELDEKDKYYINKAIEFTNKKTASKLSEITHTFDMWKNAQIGEIMSFDLLDDFSIDDLKQRF